MDNICIPMHLDAYALSPDCCDGTSKLAPYTQPNYTSLRLDSHLIQHDVLDHVDFHTSSPASKNPRLADLTISPPNNLKPNRMGIHLHWSLPRLYRTAIASGREQGSQDDSKDPTQPVFRQIPTRWLVVRHLKNFQDENLLPEFQSWVVESDAVRKIKTIPDDVDLESDVSPFVSYAGNSGDLDVLKAQTEVFIGQKFPLPWQEDLTRSHLLGGLTVLTSSNPLFPDYALHNTNALSIIDNFSYKRSQTDTDFHYLDKAVCDYFVIGWHPNAKDDPLFAVPGDSLPLEQKYLSARLSKLLLKLTPAASTAVGTSQDRTRCLVHGAIFNVKYDSSQKPRSLAEEAAVKFTSDVKMEPLSIGTSPLDAILTFLEAHKTNADGFFGGGIEGVAENIVQIAQLLYASADEYDSRVQAQDLLSQQNYAKFDGGSMWTYAKGADPTNPNTGKPKIPSDAEAQFLNEINEAQLKLDVCTRKLKSLRWDLFAEWWKYTSEFIPDKEPEKSTRQNEYRQEVDRIKSLIVGKGQAMGLVRQIKELQDDITKLQQDVDCKISARDAYRIRSDPTICIAGLANGWPSDVMDPLEVHLSSELHGDVSGVAKIFGRVPNPIPGTHGLRDTAAQILASSLRNSNTQNGSVIAPEIKGYQAWGNKNPFVPLFIEWESMYYHVDFDKWDVQVRPSPVGHPHPQVRYAPKSALNTGVTDDSNQKDFRTLSGRINVLAQPLLNLESLVLAVLDSGSPEIQLEPEEIKAIKAKIRQIQFVAAPLSGLTNHLLTRCEGAHVKPNVRVQGEKVVPLQAAVQSSVDIDIDLATLGLIDGESALTPYGGLFAFAPDQYPKNPFKGVTHGQMLFTRLHIIDKFGQAICLPVPRPRRRQEVQPPDSKIFPCLSDNLAPDVVNGHLNTVFPTPDPVTPGEWPLCQFIQLTPSINQPARINASFLIRDTSSPGHFSAWREASDYEQPIWGWIIINYADNGLQFFQADGTFYAEIRRGGVRGTNVAPKWLPYEPPPQDPSDAAHAQLNQLVAQLSPDIDTDGTFLQSFFDMINGSIQNMPFPPSSYSAFANAIVGKPLALVNVGWSIELAEPAYQPQNSLGNRTDDAQADLEAYGFKLKIGDEERNFDGLAGYFRARNTVNDSSTDWSKLYTYFVSEPHPKVQQLVPDAYLPLHPYYINPEPEITRDLSDAKALKYKVTSVLMDPYTAIHGYSPALPTKSLALPLWTVQAAFDKMHAFFHVGPSLLTSDVPRTFDGAQQTTSVSQDGVATLQQTDQLPSIRLPIGGKRGTWTWLQPYPEEDAAAPDPRYATVQVQEDLGNVRYAPGPYTFVEGYLQLMGKLGRDAALN